MAPLSIEWARSPQDLREAQQLRFRIFCLEMGARVVPPPGAPEGLDIDRFDEHCEHLLVRAARRGGQARGEVVGTYRVLSPEGAAAAGGYYSDSEFDLAPLARLRPRMVEFGRSCVHPGWRTGGVILAMWGALTEYMLRRRLETMIGCASVSLKGGLLPAVAVWHQLRRTHLAEPRWHVKPRDGTRHPAIDAGNDCATGSRTPPQIPPLLKGYLRCGAKVLGPPALDEQFNTLDLPVMLHLADMAPRYRRHFLQGA